MAATSTFKGYVRHSATYTAENSPLWSGSARNHLVNNANHIADQASQVLVNWSASTTTGYLTPPLNGANLLAADTYYRYPPFGPVPLLMNANGTSYWLRVRMRWYLAAAGTGTARLVVGAPSRSPFARDDSGSTNAATFITTATSDAWDDAETDNLIQLDADDMEAVRTDRATLAAVGGDVVSVTFPLATIHVWAKGSVVGAVPRLTGLYIAEYCGK